jgi:hypothetical protein
MPWCSGPQNVAHLPPPPLSAPVASQPPAHAVTSVADASATMTTEAQAEWGAAPLPLPAARAPQASLPHPHDRRRSSRFFPPDEADAIAAFAPAANSESQSLAGVLVTQLVQQHPAAVAFEASRAPEPSAAPALLPETMIHPASETIVGGGEPGSLQQLAQDPTGGRVLAPQLAAPEPEPAPSEGTGGAGRPPNRHAERRHAQAAAAATDTGLAHAEASSPTQAAQRYVPPTAIPEVAPSKRSWFCGC